MDALLYIMTTDVDPEVKTIAACNSIPV
jgi:hypothetical protein